MSLIIGTWNVENFCRPLPAGSVPNPNKCAAKDQATYDAKVEALAGVITEIGPDLLGVQEVGSQEALDDLVAKLPGTWHSVLSNHPDPRGIRVGVISRFPLLDVQQRKDFPDRLRPIQVEDQGDDALTSEMGRGGLAVRVEPSPGQSLRVAVCHLKSKLLTFPNKQHSTNDERLRARYEAYALFRRTAEAVTMRGLADDLLQGDGKNRDVIVLGDFNDGWQAATTQILYGPPGSQIGTGGFTHPDNPGDANRLWNLAPHILEQGGFSRIFEGQHELIDHIMISHSLLAKFQEVSTGNEKLPNVVEAQPAAAHDKPSDHSPVVAKFNL
ncbi:endonuclease/exonuclease/phosphatase family protein [Streptomyces sp. NPDC059564]|uniref:endonuclease/exonuclease/phosphatase family protein n=1 Tax=Streptomyces sp. NPDC059564 TaxID=3346865 RepID=UPI0036C0FBF8